MIDFTQGESQWVLFPHIVGERPQPDGISLDLRIPENLAYFQGHFDEVAVVPGVVQIHWAVHYARQYLLLSHAFSHMEVVKFKELLLPRQSLELGLRYFASTCKLEFYFRSETTEYSSGRIYFHDDPV